MQCYTVYITCGSLKEAQRIGKEMVEQRLAACANILPGIQSIYWWEGKVVGDREMALFLKTTADQMKNLKKAIKDTHSYDTPCIVAWPIVEGDADYLNWLRAEVKPID